jgi:hypothetical protein
MERHVAAGARAQIQFNSRNRSAWFSRSCDLDAAIACSIPLIAPSETATGVRSMLSQFSALHAIAAQRGDGLRPELLRLLDEHRRQAVVRSILPDGDVLSEVVARFSSDCSSQGAPRDVGMD